MNEIEKNKQTEIDIAQSNAFKAEALAAELFRIEAISERDPIPESSSEDDEMDDYIDSYDGWMG